MKEMNLTPTQKARLIVLLGPRYKNNDVLRFTVTSYMKSEENIMKGREMLTELYLEALRAP